MDTLSEICLSIAQRFPPKVQLCEGEVRGYHGTCKDYVDSIVSEGYIVRSELRMGRLGPGVYFFQGGENAYEAAEWHAISRFQMAGLETAVIESEFKVGYVLDLDSEENYNFVNQTVNAIIDFCSRERPRQVGIFGHAHSAGLFARDYVGKVDGFDKLDAIRTHFHAAGSAEKGLVLLNPTAILRSRPRSRSGNC